MAGQERYISDGIPDGVDAFEKGLDVVVPRHLDNFTIAGCAMNQMVTTSISVGEPSPRFPIRDRFNDSDFKATPSKGTPYAGGYNFSKVKL